MDVVGPNGEVPTVRQIQQQLQRVVDHFQQEAQEERQPAVGLLTSEHRDVWSDVGFLFLLLMEDGCMDGWVFIHYFSIPPLP